MCCIVTVVLYMFCIVTAVLYMFCIVTAVLYMFCIVTAVREIKIFKLTWQHECRYFCDCSVVDRWCYTQLKLD